MAWGRVVVAIASLLALHVVTAAPAAADTATCGAVVTSDVVLTEDLVCATAPALVVGADGVVVDLGGHSIVVGEPEQAAVVVDGWLDATITNGTIVDGAVRIVGGSHGATVEGVQLRSYYGIQLEDSNAATIVDNDFGHTFYPLTAARSHGNEVRRNSSNGADRGLTFFDSNDNRITDNDVGNGNTANIGVTGHRNVIRDNVADLALASNIEVRGDDNVVAGNSAHRSDSWGISVVGGSNVVRANSVSHAFVGIRVDDARAVVAANEAHDNAELGIWSAHPAAGGGNRATGNGDARQCVNVRCITR